MDDIEGKSVSVTVQTIPKHETDIVINKIMIMDFIDLINMSKHCFCLSTEVGQSTSS